MGKKIRPKLNSEVRGSIIKAMEEDDVSKPMLAARMGVTPPTVYGFLEPGHNFTVDTLERVSKAMNRKFVFRLEDHA